MSVTSFRAGIISAPAECAAESPGPIKVEKHGRGPPLAAPIRRIFYLSAEGTMREHEVFPPPNPRLLQAVDAADAIIYGMGSLYTSICPSLILTARHLSSTSSFPSWGHPLVPKEPATLAYAQQRAVACME